MTAREHHPKLLVADRGRGKGLVHDRGDRPLGFEQPPYLGREGACRPLAPEDVECPVLRRRHEPRRRVFRNAANPPHLQRSAEGVLYDVFCERQIVHAEDSRERDDHAPRLAPEEMLVQVHGE